MQHLYTTFAQTTDGNMTYGSLYLAIAAVLTIISVAWLVVKKDLV